MFEFLKDIKELEDVESVEKINKGYSKDKKFKIKLKNKDDLILVYCRSGRRSREAALKLIEKGYTNVIDFGGIKDWNGEVVK